MNDIRKRILTIRLIGSMDRQLSFSKELGLVDLSCFPQRMSNKKLKEERNCDKNEQ